MTGSICRSNPNQKSMGAGSKRVSKNLHHQQQQQQKQIKIAAINGKPRVQRYLSRECEFLIVFILTFFIPPYNVDYFL